MHSSTFDTYIDPSLFEKEKNIIKRQFPLYIGHEKLVPNRGDFYVLGHEDDARVLIRGEDDRVRLVSNICRHRQATMLHGEGNTKSITCPLHKWNYDTTGGLKATPQMNLSEGSSQRDPCKGLQEWKLQNWRGLLFLADTDIAQDLENIGYAQEMDFSDYQYYRTEYHECPYNWKTFMEIYGDDYHVVPSHPGLSKMIDCETIDWKFGEKWHTQSVESTKNYTSKTTPIYEDWRRVSLETGGGVLPEYGAIWFAYYPGLMIEVYPYTITISSLHPISPEKTLNIVQFFYHNSVDESLVKTESEAYIETMIEDDDFGIRLDRGRRALQYLDIQDSGPYHDPLENGTKHFHEWYTNNFKISGDHS
ncbi:aromatic ring-hydroxylating dioxygenase subunit alpha [Candidatus Gracilibacteria bacterium]|nr:aromatic ring-hydroxylating dioxygenase subunit alpha [Candidatus Gracilibacteria bacterium]